MKIDFQYPDGLLSDVYRHTIHNRAEVEASRTCHCICCQTSFQPSEINAYADGGDTAICPNCDCDAVIGDACGFELTGELLGQLHDKYFNYEDIDTTMNIYIVTDMKLVEGAYIFNAVHAFKSMTSVESYRKYFESTGEDHKLIVTPSTVSDMAQSISVVTEFTVTGDNAEYTKSGDMTEYRSTTVFEDYEDARDYKADLKETHPEGRVEFDIVKIRSRFTPNILNSGWANF